MMEGMSDEVKKTARDMIARVEVNPKINPAWIADAEVLKVLLDIKGTEGKFVTRQIRWFLHKFCPSNGWHHNDDLAVAGIYLGPTP